MVLKFEDVLAVLQQLNPLQPHINALVMFDVSIKESLCEEDLKTVATRVLVLFMVTIFVQYVGQVLDPNIGLILNADQQQKINWTLVLVETRIG